MLLCLLLAAAAAGDTRGGVPYGASRNDSAWETADAVLQTACGDNRDVAVGDVDADGFEDVVMPCKVNGHVIVAFGPDFARRQTIGRVAYARSVALGVFNGRLDVFVGSSQPRIHRYVRRGGAWAVDVLPSLAMTNWLGVHDLGAGPALVAVAQQASKVRVLTPGPAGWVTRVAKLPKGKHRPKQLHAVLVAAFGNATRPGLVLLDNRFPPFVLPEPLASAEGYPVEARKHLGARAACAADIDGDGVQDLVVAYKFDDSVQFYRGSRGGGFEAPRAVCQSGKCKYACGVACADLDGDGATDIAVASRDRSRIHAFFRRGKRFHRVDAAIPRNAGACALAAFKPAANRSAIAYAARHERASFGVVTFRRRGVGG